MNQMGFEGWFRYVSKNGSLYDFDLYLGQKSK